MLGTALIDVTPSRRNDLQTPVKLISRVMDAKTDALPIGVNATFREIDASLNRLAAKVSIALTMLTQ